MDATIIIIVATIAIALFIVAVGMYLYHRRAERIKNRGLIRQIREQDRIRRELERTRIEKNILEELIKDKLKDNE